ncbi:hypothetical protein BKA63DRAFT_497951, partial [Paraphoma chrysanthemicola]
MGLIAIAAPVCVAVAVAVEVLVSMAVLVLVVVVSAASASIAKTGTRRVVKCIMAAGLVVGLSKVKVLGLLKDLNQCG